MTDFAPIYVILSLVTAALVSGYAIPVIIRVARIKKLVDTPDNGRKFHIRHITNLGGVAIFTGFLIGFSLWVAGNDPYFFPFMLAGLLLLFATGLKDDLMVIDPYKKLVAQVLAAVFVVVGGRIRLENIDGFLGASSLPEWMAVPVTVFAIVVIINAFNLIDGIDGLAGLLGLIAAVVFGWLFFVNGQMGEATMAAAMAGALMGFLYYNLEPARIFMGDTGSMIIGYVTAILAFRFIGLNTSATEVAFETPTLLAFTIMIIPMFDTARVILIRSLNRQPPFRADNRHIHHCLLRFGYGHRGVCWVLSLATLAIIAASWLMNAYEIHLYLLLVLLLCITILPLAWLLIRFRGLRRQGRLGELFSKRAVITDLIKPCISGPTYGELNSLFKTNNGSPSLVDEARKQAGTKN